MQREDEPVQILHEAIRKVCAVLLKLGLKVIESLGFSVKHNYEFSEGLVVNTYKPVFNQRVLAQLVHQVRLLVWLRISCVILLTREMTSSL